MALIELIDNLSKSIDNKEFSIGKFVDLSKAFDTVNHKIIIQKPHHYGIRGTSLLRFEDYLRNRQQFTKYDETLSSTGTIKCGSILGPLLFLLYINDISNSSNLVNFILFADNTSIFSSGNDLCKLVHNANQELIKLSTWFKANKLYLNLKKTKYILF